MFYNSNKSSQLPPFSRPNLGAGDFHSAALMHPLSEIRIRASLYPPPRSPHHQPQRQQTKKPESWKVGKSASTPPVPCRLPPAGNGYGAMQSLHSAITASALLLLTPPVNHHTSASLQHLRSPARRNAATPIPRFLACDHPMANHLQHPPRSPLP